MTKEKKQYNIGDKFIVTIAEKYAPTSPNVDSPEVLYRMNGFRSLVFDAEGLSKLKPYDPKKEIDIEAIRDDAYYNGAREAWELARAIVCDPSYGNFSLTEITEIFKTPSYTSIMSENTFTEAKDKVEAWRTKKAQKSEIESFKPGDVVKHIGTGELAVVATYPEYGSVCVVTRDGLRSVTTKEYFRTDSFYAH